MKILKKDVISESQDPELFLVPFANIKMALSSYLEKYNNM